MRKILVRFAQRILAARTPRASFEADFVDAFEMIDVAFELRKRGCEVRRGALPFRLTVTMPAIQRYTVRIPAAQVGR